MALKRIIPCLSYNGHGLVKTLKFRKPTYVGDPLNAIKIYNDKEVDELILLDIFASREQRRPNFSAIAEMASEAFMPFAYGGGVKTFEDFQKLFNSGIEKVIVNTLILEKPDVVKRVVDVYGSQAVVASVDYRKAIFGKIKPFNHRGKKIRTDLFTYIKYLEEKIGVGEIMLQSADKDGTWAGYDFDITAQAVNKTSLPVIAAGGCGSIEDLKKILFVSNANSAALGSMAVFSKKGMGVMINFPERKDVLGEQILSNTCTLI